MASYSDSRSAQPSTAQVEALISFLETRLDLARGFGKSKTHRERAHKDWFRIGLKLNNMPGGTVKTTQRWIKYWSDKKSAVKKKAAIIESSQHNGDEGEIPELSDLEERILAMMKTVNASNSLLYRHLKKEPTEHIQDVSSHKNIVATYLLEDEMGEEEEEHAETTNDEAEDAFLSAYRFNDSNQSKHREENNHSHTPTVSSSRWGRLKLPPKPDPPPLPPQSNFFLVADKLCRIEQQRLELDKRMMDVMERNSERDHMLAEAVKAMGEGLKALAEAIAKN